MDAIQVPLENIILDSRLQMRATMDMNAIDEYAEITMQLDPGRIVRSGEQMWLTDGWHTYHAHKKAGLKEMKCFVREGNFFAALIEAAAANSTHGMKRSDADKRRAVATILAQMPSKSDREVAQICRVSPTFVGKVKNTQNPQLPSAPTTSGAVHVDSDQIRCPACARKARVGQDVPKRCKDCAKARKDAASPVGAASGPLPSQAEPPSPEETDHPAPPIHDGRVLDDAGEVVPQTLIAAFNLRSLIREAAHALSKASSKVFELENCPTWQTLKHSNEAFFKFRKPLQGASKALRDNLPSVVHDLCGGDGCDVCGHRGFLNAAEAKASKKAVPS